MSDTNFKEQDPKRQHNPDNAKDRSGNYERGNEFDPTDGVRPENLDEGVVDDTGKDLDEDLDEDRGRSGGR